MYAAIARVYRSIYMTLRYLLAPIRKVHITTELSSIYPQFPENTLGASDSMKA